MSCVYNSIDDSIGRNRNKYVDDNMAKLHTHTVIEVMEVTALHRCLMLSLILIMYISVCIQSLQQVSTLFGFGCQVFSVKWICTDHYGNPFNDFNTSCIHCGDLSRIVCHQPH